MPVTHRIAWASTALAGAAATTLFAVAAPVAQAGTHRSFIGQFHKLSTIASTVPSNGDINPYGVAVVGRSQGKLVQGNVLISNFNNRKNLQGTGTTIVQVSPQGQVSQFAKIVASKLPGSCPGGVGLTTALDILQGGWVVVGSLPTTNGMAATAQAGCLIILDIQGRVRETLSGNGINGPWDMTAATYGPFAQLFVSNVLNGTVAASPNVVNGGTVVRIGLALSGAGLPAVTSETVIGNGLPERTDPAALVVGPTGLGLASDGTLYVADSVANRVAAISDAMHRTMPTGGSTVTSGGAINDPLGLAIAPNGDVLTTNGGDGNLVETMPAGQQVAVKMLDTSPAPPGPNGNGTLFGLAVVPDNSGVYFVDDGTNTLAVLH